MADLRSWWTGQSRPVRPSDGRSAASANSTVTQDGSDARFDALRRRFIVRTREDYAVLQRHESSAELAGADLAAIVHRLAGTSGMLGYAAISEVAGRMDEELAEKSADGRSTLKELLSLLEKTFSFEGTPSGS